MGVVSLVVAIISLAIAGYAIRHSSRSADAAEESAKHARRSADAAERSVSIQEGETRRSQRADVRPLRWEGRPGKNPEYGPRGLQLKNFGPAVASDVVGEVRMGETSFKRGEVPAISPGDTVGLSTQLQDFSPSDDAQIPELGQGKDAARAIWKNADGSKGSTDWQIIETTS